MANGVKNLKRVILALLVSLLIHITFFAGTGGSGNSPGGGSKPPGGYAPINVIPRGDLEVKKELDIPKSDDKSKIKQPKKRRKIAKKAEKGHECVGDNWYGGIGIQFDQYQLVQEVYEGYPAAKNGFMKGDLLISPEQGTIRGEPGTELEMTVLRGSTMVRKRFLREKICYEEKKK